ncbi:MAG: LPS export ABC transporter periplasmic protein LptC [FCB group bacterium]|nr:LPS export ABC transporter periplasmic protein LptC [FCB group bacterium]
MTVKKGLFLWLAFMGIFVACSSTSELPNTDSREGRPDQESWGVTITMTESGVKRAEISAGHLQKFNEQNYTNLENNVIVDLYNDREVHTTRIYSDRAEVEEKSNFMRAISHVVVLSDSGVNLYTDTLSWDNEEGQVYTEDSVMVTTESGDTLYGIGFESDARMEHWTIDYPSGVTGKRYE